MSVAIVFSSAFRAGKKSIVSGSMNGGNQEPAFNSNYVRWFSTPGMAQRYIDNYMLPGEKAAIVNKEDVLSNAAEYF